MAVMRVQDVIGVLLWRSFASLVRYVSIVFQTPSPPNLITTESLAHTYCSSLRSLPKCKFRPIGLPLHFEGYKVFASFGRQRSRQRAFTLFPCSQNVPANSFVMPFALRHPAQSQLLCGSSSCPSATLQYNRTHRTAAC